jgi:hypothetical protein
MFRHVQDVLRELGEVVSETEHSYCFTSEILNLETRILVLSQEMERLSLMMAASDSLEILIAVNDSLSRVSRERDNLSGRRRLLTGQSASPIINIMLFEPPLIQPPPVPRTFGERVSRSFLNSWENTIYTGGNLLEFLALISVPLVIWLCIGSVVALAAKKKVKKIITKRRKKREAENEIV